MLGLTLVHLTRPTPAEGTSKLGTGAKLGRFWGWAAFLGAFTQAAPSPHHRRFRFPGWTRCAHRPGTMG